MMTILTTQISLLLLLLLSITTFYKSLCSNHTVVGCNEKDRETLLTFKQGINDTLGRILTWSTEIDCCAWEGVHCDNITGRVTKLDLNGKSNFDNEPFLKGSIPHSWKNLEYLFYINLWSNRLSGEVLVNLSDWRRLQFMNLGENEFSGTIPLNIPQYLEVFIY
ncbi:putative non-specific serine/threonine protein kinase [Medicago truncatula]|uniref:Putative non-specific serine/threonine protein kinase n=1 Tax=Medicago truncatula TaxID=3880 RepID=A0A396IRG6_MEDTR|nr:putative non-specific serine/threonine protein kinase [Medicago truncatula]